METIVNWGLMNYACENAERRLHDRRRSTLTTPGDMRAPGRGHRHDVVRDRDRRDRLCGGRRSARASHPELYRQGCDARQAVHVSKALATAYREGAERFGWETPHAGAAFDERRQRARRLGRRDRHVGRALHEDGGARALGADGHLEVASARVRHRHRHLYDDDAGRGGSARHRRRRITARLGDSDLPEAPVEGGSWTAASAGAAVQLRMPIARPRSCSRPRRKMERKPLGDVDVRGRRASRRTHAGEGRCRRASVALDEIMRASGRARSRPRKRPSPARPTCQHAAQGAQHAQRDLRRGEGRRGARRRARDADRHRRRGRPHHQSEDGAQPDPRRRGDGHRHGAA